MNNLQVVIDAGHGGTDPGAVSGNVKEKDLTLMISKYMYEQFQKRGIPVTIVRDTDETLSPDERVKRILAAYGDNPNVVILSNHINSSTSSSSEGAEVIYALRNNSNLAENVLQAFANSGQVVRKFYQRRLPSDTSKDYYFIHRNTGSKTQPLIIEYGFINNPTDLARIQNNYKTYVDNIVDAVIATAEGETVLPDGEDVYIVKAGDSLWSIANRFGTTVDALKKLNNLTSNNLSIGQVLRIPSSTSGGTDTGTTGTYTVKAGDTLYGIANRFNTTVDAIKSLNNLTSNNLSIGQVLRIPGLSTDTDTGTTGTYTVVSGDSLWSIANRFNTTVDAIKSLNNLTSNNLSIGQVLKIPGLSTGTDTGTGTTTTYTVVSGDTLWNIANRFNTTVDAIKSLNNLSNNMLSIGQVLKIPSTTSNNNYINYTVKAGDSLWNIARKYDTTVNEIKSLNGLTSDNLSIGQVLKIPN